MAENIWLKVFLFGVMGFLVGPGVAHGLWYLKFHWSWPGGGEGTIAQAMIYQHGLYSITLLGLLGGPLFGIIMGFSASLLWRFCCRLCSRRDEW